MFGNRVKSNKIIKKFTEDKLEYFTLTNFEVHAEIVDRMDNWNEAFFVVKDKKGVKSFYVEINKYEELYFLNVQ